MYWSGLVSDQFFFNHIFFYPFAVAGDSTAVTLQGWLVYQCLFMPTCYGMERGIIWLIAVLILERFRVTWGITIFNTQCVIPNLLLPSFKGCGMVDCSIVNSVVDLPRKKSLSQQLIGIRCRNTTKHLLIDIDRGSKCHPDNDRANWDRLLFLLEQLGLIDPEFIRSSDSGEIHIYYWFPTEIESFKLAALVRVWLESAGFTLAKGQIETFPNTKSYNSNFNAHRLPFQAGSLLLDQYGDPLNHPANRSHAAQLAYFADRVAQTQQCMATLKSKLKWGYEEFLTSRHRRTSSGVDVAQWRQNWAETIELGWKGRGQTNDLLQVMVGYSIVFEGIEDKQELFDRVKSLVLSAPGYRQYCNHQHQIDRRIWDWVNLTIDRNYYTPYQSRPGRTGEYPGLTIDRAEAKRPRSTKRHDSIVDRITTTVQTIIERLGALPTCIRDRIKLMIDTSRELFGSGFGVNTLYKSYYLGLWQSAETAEIGREAETQLHVSCSQFCDREPEPENNAETESHVSCSQFSAPMKLISSDDECSVASAENLPQVSKDLLSIGNDLSNIYSPIPSPDPQSEIQQLGFDRSLNTFSSSNQDLDPDSLDRPKSLPDFSR